MIFASDKIFLGDLQPGKKASFAIFLSGSGTNAEVLLNDQRIRSVAEPTVLVTDAPEKSRAGEIAEKHNLPLAALSIREFYRQHGLNTISLATEEGRKVRELWTQEMRQMLQDYRIDFAVLAGFESLTNLTNDYPCINVHPGDLTVTDSDGNRLYTGLHSKPIEAAVLAGETSLRSSVIIALPFTDANKDADNGLLLGISQPMEIGDLPCSLEELRQIKSSRPAKKPAGGWKDQLEILAQQLQDKLKFAGDHFILPLVVRDFAKKCFAYQEDVLYYRPEPDQEFSDIYTIEYDKEGNRKEKSSGNISKWFNKAKKLSKVLLISILLLLTAAGGLSFWLLPKRWNTNVQEQILVPHDKILRVKNITPGNFGELHLEAVELGEKTQVFLKAPSGIIELDIANSNNLTAPGIKQIRLQKSDLFFDHNKLTLNGLKIQDLLKLINDLPRNKDQRIIPVSISGRLKTPQGKVMGDLTLQIKPTEQDNKVICLGSLSSSGAKDKISSWESEVDLSSGKIAVTVQKGFNWHIFAYLLKTAGTHPAAIDLLKSARLSGQSKFQFDAINDRVSELFFDGKVYASEIRWYKTPVKISRPFALTFNQQPRQLLWQIKSLYLKMPTSVSLKDIQLEQKPFGSRLSISASCDLRQTAVDYLCELFGHPSILINSTGDPVSGSWNMRTGQWKITGKTHVNYYQKNVKLNQSNQPMLDIVPLGIDIAASGKGSSGTISKLHLDFINLKYQNKLWSCQAEHGVVDITANFGKNLAINPDTVSFIFSKLKLSSGKIQTDFPTIAGQMNLRQQKKNQKLKIAANGPEGSLKKADKFAQFGRWSLNIDLESAGKVGLWDISRFVFEVPELTLKTSDQNYLLKKLHIRSSGKLDQCNLINSQTVLQADTITSEYYTLQQPSVNMDLDRTRTAADTYRVQFSARHGIFSKPLFGISEMRNSKINFNSKELDLSKLPAKMQLQAQYLQFNNQDLLADINNCSCNLEQISNNSWKAKIGFNDLAILPQQKSFGNGNFGKGELALQFNTTATGEIQELHLQGGAEQPVWICQGMNIGGKSLYLDFQGVLGKKFSANGNIKITQADYLASDLAISAPELKSSFQAADQFNISGELDINDGTINLAKDVELRKTNLTLPWLVTNSSAKYPQPGKISVQSALYKQHPEGSFSGTITHRLLMPTVLRKAPEHTVSVSGKLLAEKFNHEPVQTDLRWHLPPEEPTLKCQLALPEAQLVQVLELNKYLPLPAETILKQGLYSFNILFQQQNNSEVINSNITILNSDLQLDSLQLQGATANLNLTWKNKQPVSVLQDAAIGSISWKNHQLQDNDLKFSLNENSQLLITSWNARYLDGKLKLAEPLSASLTADKHTAQPVKFEISGVTAETLFKNLKLDFIKSKMKLAGILNTYLDRSNNKFYIDNADLSARTPGGELQQIVPGDPDSVKVKDQLYRDFALAVLKSMRSSRSSFKFSLKPGEVNMQISTDGTPAKPVPFVYQGSTHGSPFRPAEPGEVGFVNEIELNVNLKMYPEDPGL